METAQENLRPLREMPIWARLNFADMIPNVYDPAIATGLRNTLHASDAVVIGFERTVHPKFGDIVWIHYELPWPEDEKPSRYLWPAMKNVNKFSKP